MIKPLVTAAFALAFAFTASAADSLITVNDFTTEVNKATSLTMPTGAEALTLTSSWTVQFDAKITQTTGQWTEILRIGHSNNNNLFKLWIDTTNYKVGFDSVTGGSVSPTSGTSQQWQMGTTSNGELQLLDGKAHTYTIISTGTLTPTLSLYVDNSLTPYASCDFNFSGQNTATWKIDSLQLGGQRLAAEISNVALYEGEHKPTVSIPEPATATLSLLALAGLAARRRRK